MFMGEMVSEEPPDTIKTILFPGVTLFGGVRVFQKTCCGGVWLFIIAAVI